MSGQYFYEFADVIPFSAILVDNNGSPRNAVDVRIDVFDLNAGTKIVDAVALPEIALTGVYRYLWVHGFLVPAQLFAAIYEVSGNKRIYIDTKEIKIANTRQALIDKIDDSDGAAV